MNEYAQNIIEAINESFLHDKEKRILLEQFAREGSSDSFFATMNTFLIDELKKRGNKYEEMIENFENRSNNFEYTYKHQKQELDADLEKDLSGADPINVSAKENVFDAYYKNLNSLQVNYETSVRGLYSQLSVLTL